MTAIGVIILLLDGTIQQSVIALTERLASRQLYTLSRAYTRILFRVNAKAYMYSTDQQKGKAWAQTQMLNELEWRPNE